MIIKLCMYISIFSAIVNVVMAIWAVRLALSTKGLTREASEDSACRSNETKDRKGVEYVPLNELAGKVCEPCKNAAANQVFYLREIDLPTDVQLRIKNIEKERGWVFYLARMQYGRVKNLIFQSPDGLIYSANHMGENLHLYE